MDGLSALAALLATDPANEVLALDLLDQLITANRLDEARACLALLAPSISHAPSVEFRRARIAMLAFDFAGAIAILQSLLSHADVPGVRHDLAFCQMSLGRLDEAEATLLPAVNAMVEVPAIGFLNARILHYRAQYEQAALVAQAACDQHPGYAEGWGILAMIQLDRSDVVAARDASERALALSSIQPDALTVRGSLALWHGQPAEAVASFGQALHMQPHSARALAGAGEAFMLGGDVSQARRLLEQATARAPEHIGTWHALAWCALLESDLSSAWAAFEHAMQIDHNFGETHGGLALVHVLRGELEEGRAATRRALRLDPHSRNGRYAQSLLWQDEGKLREANAMVDGILADTGVDTSRRPADFIQLLRARLTPTG